MSESDPSVLLFADRFTVRGSCAYTLRLAENLPQRGFQTSVICPDARVIDRERQKELRITEYPYLLWPLWGAVVRRTILASLRINPPDLIHVQSRSLLPSAMRIGRKLACPLVLTVHDYLHDDERLEFDPTICQRIIAVSESVKDDLVRKTGIAETRVTVIRSGVDCVHSLKVSDVFRGQNVPVIGTAGPLEAVKGFPFFLEGAAKVLAKGREVEFLIAGAGPEESNLRKIAKRLGINDRVTFVPNLLDFDDALAAMDVFVLPSLQQGIGTIMLDAMALGRPVIATNVGGVNSALKDGETGILIPPGNSQELAQKMIELLDHPDRARHIGQSARQAVNSEFNVEQMIDKTVQLYREILRVTKAEIFQVTV